MIDSAGRNELPQLHRRWIWQCSGGGRFLLRVIASLVLGCLVLDVDGRAQSPQQTLRVATLNHNFANRNGDDMIDAIIRSDADICCLQETSIRSERFLKSRLSNRYAYTHSVGHQGRYAAERFTILSTMQLERVVFTPPDAGLFGWVAAEVKFHGKTIQIINVHLSPLLVRRGDGVSKAMKALGTAEDVHAREIDSIVQKLQVHRPTIIAGDFNSISTFKAPVRLKELGLVDSYASANENADADATWNWPTRPLPLALRIDYIFHTDHFRTVSANIIPCKGSDHALVVAELKFDKIR